jgi:hypothetical protein
MTDRFRLLLVSLTVAAGFTTQAPALAAFITDTGRVKGSQQQSTTSSGNEGSASAIVGARDQAAIYRVRSMIRNQYNPKVVCAPSDVNIGTNSKQPTYVGNLTVVTGGACPKGAEVGE